MKSPEASATIDLLRTEVAGYFQAIPAGQRDAPTALPYFSFIRFTQPTELNRGMLEPSMCLVLQGRKKILIGDEIIRYGAGSFTLAAIDMPVAGQVTQASEVQPYFGIRIDLDAKEIAALILDAKIAAPRHVVPSAGAYVEQASTELQDALLRLLQLLKTPQHLPALAPLIKQEILYRLLTSPGGDVLYRVLQSQPQQKSINRAIQWIRKNFDRPLQIEQLADTIGMSESALHHRFKAITLMSPLQYQKQLRLLEARKLLLAGNVEAATVAFKVGYESPSQFSREYRRLFGAPPLQDIERMERNGAALVGI